VKNKSKVLIVGGTGFLGYHLCKAFLKKKWTVLSLSLKLPIRLRKLKGVKYYLGNISKEREIRFLENQEIEYIINCGGYVDHYNKIQTYNSHVKGCKNLINIFSKKKIKTYIQIGSSMEYGLVRSPQKENYKEKPVGSYGKYKLLASKFLRRNKKSFPFVILRLYQVYGPNQSNNRLIPFVINSCLKKKNFPCSDGNQLRDFLYVDDFVKSVIKALNNKKCYGETINIGEGKPVKLKKIIKSINNYLRYGNPQFGKAQMRKGEQKKVFPSIKKASKYLGWKPKINFITGIKKTIKFYKSLNR